MRKISKNKKVWFVLVMLICLFSAAPFVFAQASADYSLHRYDFHILVNENNTLEITEKIEVFFNKPKQGFYRKIPLRNEINRFDGTSSFNRAKVSEIEVSENYKAYRDAGYQVIKIGDADYTLTNVKDYTLKYRYNLGPDTGKNYDEIYFNLIRNEWDTIISNVTFTIIMPKEFEEEKLDFFRGRFRSVKNSDIEYQVKGNVITGRYLGTLMPGQTLTVKLELPEGYFVGASRTNNAGALLSIIVSIIFPLIIFCLWKKYGKDHRVVKTVEFYPPAGFNSAEVGFLYKGKADQDDVISLLVYLANKGYIKIEEFEQKVLFSKVKKFKLVKVKDYDGNNAREELFLQELFKRGPEVEEADLYNEFYETVDQIIKEINSQDNKHKIFEKTPLGMGFLIILMSIIIYMLITINPVLDSYGGILVVPFALILPALGMREFLVSFFGKTSLYTKMKGLLAGIGVGGFSWFLLVFPALKIESLYALSYLIGCVSMLLLFFFYKIMPKRTVYGNELLGKIKGFKTFLKTAKKPKLEILVREDPAYFYNILPYAYVLGVSDKWIKKFESIAVKAPDWYCGNSMFSMSSFSTFMAATVSPDRTAMFLSRLGDGSGGGGGGSW